MRELDSKYSLDGERIINSKTGAEIPPDEPLFVIRARDALAIGIINAYISRASDLGCGGPMGDFLHDLVRTRNRFEAWRNTPPGQIKLPD